MLLTTTIIVYILSSFERSQVDYNIVYETTSMDVYSKDVVEMKMVPNVLKEPMHVIG